jgi:hypothetical protein
MYEIHYRKHRSDMSVTDVVNYWIDSSRAWKTWKFKCSVTQSQTRYWWNKPGQLRGCKVEHSDVRPLNVLWNPEIRILVPVDFKRSQILKQMPILLEMSPYPKPEAFTKLTRRCALLTGVALVPWWARPMGEWDLWSSCLNSTFNSPRQLY